MRGMDNNTSNSDNAQKKQFTKAVSSDISPEIREQNKCADSLVNAMHTIMNENKQDEKLKEILNYVPCNNYRQHELLKRAYYRAFRKAKMGEEGYEDTAFNLAIKADYYKNYWKNMGESWGPVLITAIGFFGWTWRSSIPAFSAFKLPSWPKGQAKGDGK